MAKKIGDLTPVTSIAGTELVEVSQSGVSKRATINQINNQDTTEQLSISAASRQADGRLDAKITAINTLDTGNGYIADGTDVATLDDLVISSTNDIWISAGDTLGTGVYVPNHLALGTEQVNGVDYGGVITMPIYAAYNLEGSLFARGFWFDLYQKQNRATTYGIYVTNTSQGVSRLVDNISIWGASQLPNESGITIDRLMGVIGDANLQSDGSNVSEFVGVEGKTFTTGDGAIIDVAAAGRFETISQSSQKSIVSGGGYGVLIKTPEGNVAAGSNNLYGLYVEDQSQKTNWASKYNIYSAGANSENYFEGNLYVGGNHNISTLTRNMGTSAVQATTDGIRITNGSTALHIYTQSSNAHFNLEASEQFMNFYVNGSRQMRLGEGGGNALYFDNSVVLSWTDGTLTFYGGGSQTLLQGRSSFFTAFGNYNAFFQTMNTEGDRYNFQFRERGQNNQLLLQLNSTKGMTLYNAGVNTGYADFYIGKEVAILDDLVLESSNSIHLSAGGASTLYYQGTGTLSTITNGANVTQTLTVGADESQEGSLYIYGGDPGGYNPGGELRIYLGGYYDDNDDYFRIWAENTAIQIGTDGDDFISYDTNDGSLNISPVGELFLSVPIGNRLSLSHGTGPRFEMTGDGFEFSQSYSGVAALDKLPKHTLRFNGDQGYQKHKGLLFVGSETGTADKFIIHGHHTMYVSGGQSINLSVSGGETFYSDPTSGAWVSDSDILPLTSGLDLGKNGKRWENVWGKLINGGDIGLENNWRLLESEKYEGYPVGFAIGNQGFVEGRIAETAIGKPIFAVTEDFIEYKGVRITKEKLEKLLELI
jgi:hypothetical protein